MSEPALPFSAVLDAIAFDANGDLKNKIISVFKITKDPNLPLDDAGQYKFVGTAPMS